MRNYIIDRTTGEVIATTNSNGGTSEDVLRLAGAEIINDTSDPRWDNELPIIMPDGRRYALDGLRIIGEDACARWEAYEDDAGGLHLFAWKPDGSIMYALDRIEFGYHGVLLDMIEDLDSGSSDPLSGGFYDLDVYDTLDRLDRDGTAAYLSSQGKHLDAEYLYNEMHNSPDACKIADSTGFRADRDNLGASGWWALYM